MGSVSIAVGCAVGIPIGTGMLVAFFFWVRLQRRYRKEEQQDKELEDVIRNDNGFISFDNLETLQESQAWKNKSHIGNDDPEVFEERKLPDQHVGSGSSDGSGSHDEKISHITGQQDKGKTVQQQPQRGNSKHYVPAYRRKINAVRQSTMDGSSTNNSSTASLDSSQKVAKRQISIYDQMIPVAVSDERGLFTEQDAKDRQLSNDNLIKNLNSQNLGSYYPRRASSSSLTQLNTTNHSGSSFHTRASSVNSLVKPSGSAENVFDTPKSEKTSNAIADYDKIEKPDDVYLLKNNYDILNTSEIAEEDQYENEFTNYSENKREFINTLRPKKQ